MSNDSRTSDLDKTLEAIMSSTESDNMIGIPMINIKWK